MKLPDKIFGMSTEKAYMDYLEESEREKPKEKKEKPLIIPAINIADTESYIILPGKKHGNYEYPDLLVAMEKSHYGKNWTHAYDALLAEDSFMFNPRQFVDFINLLKTGDAYDGKGNKIGSKKLESILDEILTVRPPWRAEWLNAKFTSQGILKKQFYVEDYDPINKTTSNESLENCLMKDKTPGIDLNYWLNNANSQGLPPKNTPDGNLYFWHPRNGAVAWFDAYSVGAGLVCGRLPRGSVAGLGVRAAKIKV